MANQAAAIWYADRLGWPVLPLHTPMPVPSFSDCSCGHRTCSSVGKHPRTAHGVHDATTDLEQIMEWWDEWPDANIGIATGVVSNLIVVDVDPRNGGDESFKELTARHGKPSMGLSAWTGGGGYHLFFKYKDQPVVYRPAKGIEIKADGGYIVAAPSLHASGEYYRWRVAPHPDLDSLTRAPSWCFGFYNTPATGPGSNLTKLDPKRIVKSGERNSELARLMGRWRRVGMTESEMHAAGAVHNRMFFEPPLDDDEVRRTAKSIARYEPVEEIEIEPVSSGWQTRKRSTRRKRW